MIFSRCDYNARIVECDMQALKELFEELIDIVAEPLSASDDKVFRSGAVQRFANCFDGKIPAQEPVFLIRGQDQAGHLAVRSWANHHRLNGGSDPMFDSAMRHADLMEQWAKKHGKPADGPV